MTGEHKITMASGPLRSIVLCSCGWRHEEPRKQNALGRASKMKGAANRHLRAVEPKPEQDLIPCN